MEPELPTEPIARSSPPRRSKARATRRATAGMLVGLGLITLAASASISCAADDPGIGRSYQVPYRLTETNHFLVRLRINGKGPFNFLVDTGAPAFFISTETAKKVGLEPARDSFWTRVERVDFEGGATLLGMRARIEDPFQLVGMNALGLPGASIDGLIGYTVLARFRIELDPTKDRMTWTRLDFNPVDPPVPHRRNPGDAPAEMQAMNALGPLAKGLAFLMGKQAEEQLHPRGFLGLEWSELKEQIGATGKTATTSPIQINRVLPGSPAARAGVQPGDRLIRLKGKEIQDRKAILTDLAQIHPGDPVRLTIRRGEGPQARELDLTVTAGEGF